MQGGEGEAAAAAAAGTRTVGVLALQGSFNEHIAALRRVGVRGVEVRKADHLHGVGALIIPGGESTTMAKVARYQNLFPALRDFVKSGKPVWGTCAGLIFLADKAIGQKEGGQEFIGGLDCLVHRNFFGSQLESFETEIPAPALAKREGGSPNFRAVFIRAPAILKAGPNVEILAEYNIQSNRPVTSASDTEGEESMSAVDRVIVAARQGSLLVTAFHPELTADTRWHSFFLKMCDETDEQNLQTISTGGVALDNNQDAKQIYLPIFE